MYIRTSVGTVHVCIIICACIHMYICMCIFLHFQVDKMAKDLKVSKKKSGGLSSEVAQCNMRIRGLQEELRSEKEKNRLSNEYVAMLKESLESKQSSVVELKRMVSVEIMDAGD